MMTTSPRPTRRSAEEW